MELNVINCSNQASKSSVSIDKLLASKRDKIFVGYTFFYIRNTLVAFSFGCFLMFKIGLSTSKNICFICFNDSPLKMMKSAFYLIL